MWRQRMLIVRLGWHQYSQFMYHLTSVCRLIKSIVSKTSLPVTSLLLIIGISTYSDGCKNELLYVMHSHYPKASVCPYSHLSSSLITIHRKNTLFPHPPSPHCKNTVFPPPHRHIAKTLCSPAPSPPPRNYVCFPRHTPTSQTHCVPPPPIMSLLYSLIHRHVTLPKVCEFVFLSQFTER